MKFPNTDFLQNDLEKLMQKSKTNEVLLWTAVVLPKLHSYFERHAQRQQSKKQQNCLCSCERSDLVMPMSALSYSCVCLNTQNTVGKKD